MEYFFILQIIFQSCFSHKIRTYLLSNSYEIILKVHGSGIKQILNYGFTCPTEVYLNNNIQNLSDCHRINVFESGSEIKLLWNKVINPTSNMFYGCNNITEIDLTKFDTSEVTDMSNMFEFCSSITSINVSNFNTKKVTRMNEMFRQCLLLPSINLKSFDTSSVTTIERMFSYCQSLTSIDIADFNTSLFSEIYSLILIIII